MVEADVLVMGGGPAGSAAAISCARAGLRVVVVERMSFPRNAPGETLHPGIEPLLWKLGVGSEMLAAEFLRHEGHWVRWAGPLEFIPFGQDIGTPWRGFQAWRASFDSILLDRARRLGVTVWQPCSIVWTSGQAGRIWDFVTSHGRVRAHFVVDATGSRRWVAKQLGIPMRRYGPKLIAWYGYAEGSCPARDCAPAIVADRDGWTWTACVRPGVYQWTRLSFAHKRPDAGWLPHELQGLTPKTATRGADVTWRAACIPAGSGFFLAGDAAAVLDPLSSHGVLRAIMTGMMAAHLIGSVLKRMATRKDAAEAYSAWIRDWFHHDLRRLDLLYSVLRSNG